MQIVRRLKELAALRKIAFRRRRNPIQGSTAVDPSCTEPEPTDTTVSNGSGEAHQLRLRTSQVRMELLRQRESVLLAEGRSEVMQLLLARPNPELVGSIVGADGARHGGLPSELPASPWAGWSSVSCILGEDGEILCIEHTLEGLERSEALDLGRLIPGRSIYRFLRQEELECIGQRRHRSRSVSEHEQTQQSGLSGRRSLKLSGYELLVFPSKEGNTVAEGWGIDPSEAAHYGRSTANGEGPGSFWTSGSWSLSGYCGSGSLEALGGGRVIVLASASKHEFEELRDAVVRWLRPTSTAAAAASAAASAATTRSIPLAVVTSISDFPPAFPPCGPVAGDANSEFTVTVETLESNESVEKVIATTVTCNSPRFGCTVQNTSEATSEIERLRDDVVRLVSENRSLWRRLICSELQQSLELISEGRPESSLRNLNDEPMVCNCGTKKYNGGKASSALVPKAQVEEAEALARRLDLEANRLGANLRSALNLLENIGDLPRAELPHPKEC